MKAIRFIMGMPITVVIKRERLSTKAQFPAARVPKGKVLIANTKESDNPANEVFDFFRAVDARFSPFKKGSELSLMNSGKIKKKDLSIEMKKILRLARETKKQTNGYFDIFNGKEVDPSGIVKGWAIYEAAKLLKKRGVKEFYIDAGGDIQAEGKGWKIGIKNPFKAKEIVKVITIKSKGVATSGIYERGNHIYNPKSPLTPNDLVSLTVIGPNVYEADRFATAAFAMGREGIEFIERKKGLEGYMIDKEGIATMTSGFEKYSSTEQIQES